MGKHDTFVNGRSVIHKGSGDKAIAGAPDVCKTPIGSAVVPIPYPNISQSSTLENGSKSVMINGQPAALKKSCFASSKGDQAGSMKGVISGTIADVTEFLTSSFDVKIEGQNVVRHMDATFHNKKNTMGTVYGGSTTVPTIEPEKCPYCDKPEHQFAEKWGNHIGDGQALREAIISNIEDHAWYTEANALQAHHIICSEAMDNDDWSTWCTQFGYEINHKNNGVMLPYFMDLACQLHVAVHRGNHDKGMAEGVSYPEQIERDLRKIAKKIKAGKYCDNPKALIEKLDKYSKYILKKIDAFRWTITADGRDYKAGNNGCAGVTSITNKPSQPCSHDRQHRLSRKGEATILPRKTQPLETGQ